MNASFTAGIPIRSAEGADSGMGRFHPPAWGQEGFKCGLVVKDTVAERSHVQAPQG